LCRPPRSRKAHEPIELGGGGRSGRIGGDPNAAAVVGLAGHSGGELFRSIASEHQVRVRVDKAGQHARAIGIGALVSYGSCWAYVEHGLRLIVDDH